MTDPLALFDAALRGALVVLLLLLATQLRRDRPAAPATRIGVLFAVGLSLQAFASTPAFESHAPWPWQLPLVAVSVGNAVLFWLFTLALFNDDWQPRPRHAALWLMAAAVGALQCLWPTAPGTWLLRWLPLGFALLALANALARWQGDLVERRRRLRAFIVGAGSIDMGVMVAARLASPDGRLSAPAASLDVAMLLAIVAIVAWHVLRSASSDLLPAPALAVPAAPPPPAPPPADAADERLAQALERVMRDEQAFRDEDLSVAGLALRLAVPEYRLRRHINQRLGHRNFSAFVNGYRLEQAQRRLADPAEHELPVLTIALDAGFGSIGPFNRAFKAATGLTPTEFRRRKPAEALISDAERAG